MRFSQVLGAHLEAYVNLQPTISTLRLCNRYGSGPKAFITKLPIELLATVEELLMETEKASLRSEWLADFNCSRLACRIEDHITQDALHDLKEQILSGALDDDFDNDGDSTSDPDHLDLHVFSYMLENDETWSGEHQKRCRRWTKRVGTKKSNNQSFFAKSRDLVRQHLGLEIWTSFLRIGNSPVGRFNYLWSEVDGPSETVLAWLKLPRTRSLSKSYSLHETEYSANKWEVEDCASIPISPPPLSKSATARFKKAMKVLDLKPRAHPTMEKDFLGDDSEAGDEDSPEWPKLTMLIRSQAEGGFMWMMRR